jgi:hypothetical protein
MSVGTKYRFYIGFGFGLWLAAIQGAGAAQLACYLNWQSGDDEFISVNSKMPLSQANNEAFVADTSLRAISLKRNQGRVLEAVICVPQGDSFGSVELDEQYLNTPQ